VVGLAIALLVAVLLTGCDQTVYGTGTPQATSAASTKPNAASSIGPADKIEVIDFHRTVRCDSCVWVGEVSRKTVEFYFKDELASGKVTFQEIDVQKPENAALAKKFKATGSSLYLNYIKDGTDHIVEASRIYPYVGNEAKFVPGLKTMIADGLGASQ
jgi:hypothetical protein